MSSTAAAPPAVARAGTSRLEAEHLMKRYGPRAVVKDVHLAVAAGEVVGLLGPNGAGKTTTFYMVVGLLRADGGRIRIDGRPVERLPIHKRSRLGLSYLPQEASIFRKLTVEENIRAVLELQRDADGRPLRRSRIDAMLEQLLADLAIDKLRASPAPALSGGERRRVEIARIDLADALVEAPRCAVVPGFFRELGAGVEERMARVSALYGDFIGHTVPGRNPGKT
jgi:lipopolysaccharide export system ATP-binding protein